VGLVLPIWSEKELKIYLDSKYRVTLGVRRDKPNGIVKDHGRVFERYIFFQCEPKTIDVLLCFRLPAEFSKVVQMGKMWRYGEDQKARQVLLFMKPLELEVVEDFLPETRLLVVRSPSGDGATLGFKVKELFTGFSLKLKLSIRTLQDLPSYRRYPDFRRFGFPLPSVE